MSTKMGLSLFYAGNLKTDVVAPKSTYTTPEDFVKSAMFEFDYEDNEEFWDRLKVENVKEDFCRFYRIPPEGCDFNSGCYSFSREGKGAFPVWYIKLD